MPPTTRVSGGSIQKVTRTGKSGSAQTMSPSSAVAITSHHNWAHIASGVSSASSEQNEGSFRGQSLTRASSNQSLSLACPYAKLKSVVAMQSSDLGRLHCWSKSYPSISRLKQHLYRVHCLPEFICRRCQQEFSTEELLDAHSGRMPMCDPGKAECTERMTTAQEKQIKRKTRGILPETSWFAIWRILFPGQDPPASPYFQDQVLLNLWGNTLVNDLESLSAKIKAHLHGALRFTHSQQSIIDQSVQQALVEYSRELRLRIGQSQSSPRASEVDGSYTSLVDQDMPSADSASNEREEHLWSPSMKQSFLPRSTLIPGTTHLTSAMEPSLSLGLWETVQPDVNCLGQQDLADGGDLFHGLSLTPYLFPFDNKQYY